MHSLATSTAALLLDETQRAKRRWRVAFAVIKSARAIFVTAKKRVGGILSARTLSYTAIDISYSPADDAQPCCSGCGERLEDTTHLSFVNAKLLAMLAKDRDRQALQHNFGGVGALSASLLSNPEHGIHDDEGAEISRRRVLFGSNAFPRPKSRSFFRFALEAINDPMLLILLVCAAASLAFGIKEHGIKEGWYDGVSIFIAVALVVVVSAVSNYRQSRRFDKLSAESADFPVDVVRDGRRRNVHASGVVVGDVVWLKIGDQVPADGVLLDGHALRVDESSMTGEPLHVTVDRDGNPFLWSGTKVADGYGQMLVTAVGGDTTWGEMMVTIGRENSDPTPLQERLQKLTSRIGVIGTVVAVVVLAALLARYFTGSTRDENGNREFVRSKANFSNVVSALVKIVSDAVTIIVVAIPEGLPLAVTLTLAYSMKRMMADKAMVRKLPACETMGAVTTICTDKTGTLTLNQMKVVRFFVGTKQVEVGNDHDSQVSDSAAVALVNDCNPEAVIELLQHAVGLNTTGSVYRPGPDADAEITGSPTEKAILSWAVEDLSMNMELLKRNTTVLHVEAFNSQKKRSGVLIRTSDLELQLHWKGAAEMILESCSHYRQIDGSTKPLGASDKAKLERTIQAMAASSLRCIAFAYKKVDSEAHAYAQGSNDDTNAKRLEEDGLTLLGMVGLKDPCRPEVRKSVEACRKAGVGVKMVTGDNVFTARAIAVESGILTAEDQGHSDLVIEGKVFREMSQEERMEAIDRIRVMARSSPMDKLLMVECLKKKGEVVAVTGDGTNDAPALKEADVGLAMGIQGTEVAKECSDVVILDDNFQSVVTVLRWGRCVYNNIQKFLQFQLTVNVSALCINFVAAVASGKVPLTTVQMLWVNLIMDTLGALALATERPTNELMDKPPVGRTAPLITAVMWRNLLAQAAFQVTALLTLHFRGESLLGVGEKVNNTVVFNTFVFCQVFNEFNARRLEAKNVFAGVLRNHLFTGIIGVTIVLQVLMVELLTKFAGTQRLGWAQWAVCVVIASVSWPIGWLVKCLPVNKGASQPRGEGQASLSWLKLIFTRRC